MNKIIKELAGVLAGCIIMGTIALANSSAAILETYTGDSDISVYVKGTDIGEGEISVQIATTEASKVSVQSISELDVPMQTLVMIDNSLSISLNDRLKIAEFLQNLISDRMSNEEMCIATFSEDINILTEYTSDYGTLKKAIDGIVYQDQETYLTDVLYDLIFEKYVQNSEDVYRRIIVVSDGVDNKSLGYTKDELYSLLKDMQIPIYTIGCVNGKNNDELENMFAISRTTLVDYFLLDEVDDTLDITNVLNQDRMIIRLKITPSVEVMDGSKKAVKITFPNGTVATTEVTMPQQVHISQVEETPVVEEVIIEEETEVIADAEESNSNYPILIIACVAAVVIIIVLIVIVFIRKNKNSKPTFETIDENILNELNQNGSGLNEKTEMIGSLNERKDDGSTVIILDQETTYQVVLTDLNSPAKSFQVPLNKTIIIGRKKELCDIALDYEKSVSGRHCEINVRNGRFFVKDLQSSNGTYLNGSKVLTESEIFSGNKLKLGRLEMRFEVR